MNGKALTGLLIIIILLLQACRKYPGFMSIQNFSKPNSELLYCLGHDKPEEYIVRSYQELKDSLLFFSEWDSVLTHTCHDNFDSLEINFENSFLVGIVFEYRGTSGSAIADFEEEFYYNKTKNKYLIILTINESGSRINTGQVWYALPNKTGRDDVEIRYY